MTGIDLGSRFVKIVTSSGTLIFSMVPTIEFYRNFDDFTARFKGEKVRATGYGRYALDIPGAEVIPEIQAHVRGASRATGLTGFTLLDIGGQDTKVVRVKHGLPDDFLTNDKCAASCGKFLETASEALGITLDQLLNSSGEAAPLSSTCAIFAESEIISLLAGRTPVAKIASGVMLAMFQRIRPWIAAMLSHDIVLSGGIANSPALSELIASSFPGIRIHVPQRPEFLGALGCIDG
ncbi:MAG: acyl-CoA dehydratase activase [Candidatus Wallbacteria bacterium]|nr:acyl-CoA dehydratase activase [Candidatus Wallbacteria bacterium]